MGIVKWPCPKCGCSHELEKGLHERWGCYLDADEDSREVRQAENDGRLQTQTGDAHGAGGGSPAPTVTEIRSKVYRELVPDGGMNGRYPEDC